MMWVKVIIRCCLASDCGVIGFVYVCDVLGLGVWLRLRWSLRSADQTQVVSGRFCGVIPLYVEGEVLCML